MQFKREKQFYFTQFSLALVRNLNIKTVLFQTIQFIISTQFSSIWLINKTISGSYSPGQKEPGTSCYKGVPRIPPNSSNTGASASDYLVSCLGHSWGNLTPLQRRSRCILQSQPTGILQIAFFFPEMYTFLAISVSVRLSVRLCFSLSFSHSCFLTLSLVLAFSRSFPHFLSFSLSLSLSISLWIYIYTRNNGNITPRSIV